MSMQKFNLIVAKIVALTGIGIALSVSSASADQLEDALASAYTQNPDINAQRSAVKASDDGVSEAQAGFMPRVDASASAGAASVRYSLPGQTSDQNLVPRSYGLSVTQNLYNGSMTSNQLKIANANASGARAQLDSVEGSILLDATGRYLDVIRDDAVVGLMKSNFDVLSEQFRQTQDRYRVGDASNIDVSQVEAQLALARADYNTALTNATISKSAYSRVVGKAPVAMKPPAVPAKLLPKDMKAAIAEALKHNPQLLAANFGEDAAKVSIDVAASRLRPSVDVVASAGQKRDTQYEKDRMDTVSVLGTISVPIYEGGVANAQIRKAENLLSQKQLQNTSLQANVRDQTEAAWRQFENNDVRIKSAEQQIASAKIALSGTQLKEKTGQATTLDVLVSIQNVLSAELNLVTAQHDRVLSAYQVLALTGKLTAKDLKLKVALQDFSSRYDMDKSQVFHSSLQ